MELWIRSQDKTSLIKANLIGIMEGNDCWFICENQIADLGVYKTKERALEVLDEIQNILDKKKNFDEMAKYIDNGTQIIEFSTAIYEMPQEREEK